MSEDGNIVVETAERIFADLADSQAIIHARGDTWKAPLWRALTEAGLPLAWIDEAHGGAGASLADGFGVLRAAGRAALAVPLAETLLAGWLLAKAGHDVPDGALAVAPCNDRDSIGYDGSVLKGCARKVAFARDARHIAVLAGNAVALVAAKDCKIVEGVSLSGDALDNVTFDGVRPLAVRDAPAGFDTMALMQMGATVRSLQIAGALESMLTLTTTYAMERVAFEKPISKYQAVQHHLARLAGEVAVAVSAANSAADALEADGTSAGALLLEAAAAKIRCGEAAETGTGIAHQVHGAIGFTDEHVLHRLTLRALAWRDDFGSESYWAVALGRFVAAQGADDLWPLVAAR